MNIIHITRNIPVKRLKGNRVILDIIHNINKLGISQKIIFPAEYVPKLPFLKERAIIFSELNGMLNINGTELIFYKYIRLFFRFDFIISKFCLNKQKVNAFSSSADIFHAHYILPDGYIANKLARDHKKPYLVSVRQGDIDRIKKLKKDSFYDTLYKNVLVEATQVISINHSIRKYLAERYNIYSKTIPHGIDQKLFSPLPVNKKLDSSIKLVSCSQLIKRKNIDWIIDVFNKVSTDKNNIKLTIIGDGPLINKFKHISNSQITFTGELDHKSVLSIFEESDIFILPSENETFGMVYLEAAAKQCMLIGLKGTGIDGYFEDKENACFVRSKHELLSLIRNIIEGDLNYQEIALKGYRKTQTEYTWKTIMDKYQTLYMGTNEN